VSALEWTEISEILRPGGVLVLVVEVEGSTPARPGAKMAVLPGGKTIGTVGGGALEAEAAKEALKRYNSGEKGLVEYNMGVDGPLAAECGGKAIMYFEPVNPKPKLWLFGAGHVGREIAKVASVAGWFVVAVDDRPEMACADNIPEAAEYITGDYPELAASLPISKRDSVVIVTAGHLGDETVLAELIKREVWPVYVGMMGSKQKVAQVHKNIDKAGLGGERLESVRAPIGLNFGTVEPGEIAVAVVGEMLAVRNRIEEVRPCSE